MVELGQLQKSHQEFQAAGVQVIPISVDPPELAQKSREKSGARFRFLCDPELKLIDALGIRHRGGRFGKDIAIPTLFLVDRNGIIRWIYQPDSVLVRARPEEILKQVEALPRSHP